MKKMKMNIGCIAVIFMIASAALAQQCTWTGSKDQNWNNPDNWSPSGVPGPQCSVTIGTGFVNANADVMIGALSLTGTSYLSVAAAFKSSGATKVAAGATLSVTSAGAVTAGQLQADGTLSFATGSSLNANVSGGAGAINFCGSAAFISFTGSFSGVLNQSPCPNSAMTVSSANSVTIANLRSDGSVVVKSPLTLTRLEKNGGTFYGGTMQFTIGTLILRDRVKLLYSTISVTKVCNLDFVFLDMSLSGDPSTASSLSISGDLNITRFAELNWANIYVSGTTSIESSVAILNSQIQAGNVTVQGNNGQNIIQSVGGSSFSVNWLDTTATEQYEAVNIELASGHWRQSCYHCPSFTISGTNFTISS